MITTSHSNPNTTSWATWKLSEAATTKRRSPTRHAFGRPRGDCKYLLKNSTPPSVSKSAGHQGTAGQQTRRELHPTERRLIRNIQLPVTLEKAIERVAARAGIVGIRIPLGESPKRSRPPPHRGCGHSGLRRNHLKKGLSDKLLKWKGIEANEEIAEQQLQSGHRGRWRGWPSHHPRQRLSVQTRNL